MCIYCLLRPQDRSVHGETNREETNVNVVSRHLPGDRIWRGCLWGSHAKDFSSIGFGTGMISVSHQGLCSVYHVVQTVQNRWECKILYGTAKTFARLAEFVHKDAPSPKTELLADR
jgi:hypothetical protein